MNKKLTELSDDEMLKVCTNTKCCECPLRCDGGSHCKLSDLLRYGDEEFDPDEVTEDED